LKTLYLDFETSDVKQGKKRSPSPYLKENFLVCGAWVCLSDDSRSSGFAWFNHRDYRETGRLGYEALQKALDEAKVIVAYNAKFELEWLLEAGFKLPQGLKIRDPMITEYVLQRGVKLPLSLKAVAERRKTKKKNDATEALWEAGLSYNEMPMDVVEEYCIDDVEALIELDQLHAKLLQEPENRGLIPTIEMSWEFIWCLVEMARNGICIDANALADVKKEFTDEYSGLRADLERVASSVMGDTPINLDSPEQLSWVIYSRKVKDKKKWAEIFNIGTNNKGKRKKPPRMSSSEFISHVRSNTEILKRTEARHCGTCEGRGLLHKKRRDGTDFKKASKCKACNGKGYTLTDTSKIGGLRVSPQGPLDTSSGGFASDKETLNELATRLQPGTIAHEFVTKLVRYNAIGTYLETFISGIERGRGIDGLLHTQLLQHITRTGRLSSRDPNFQNMPRAKTFPVRRVVKSRWEGGEILEVDFAQLEFRVAVQLANDLQGVKDVEDKVDAHTRTAKILYTTEQPNKDQRQDAKPHTFKPLYGGSSGTDAEQAYYKWFKQHYRDIGKWQDTNIATVLKTGKLALPSGREYAFPGTRRTRSGYVTNTTQICNYPVQGFATADIVPIAIIGVYNELYSRNLNSKLILTVHDSIEFDVYPSERDSVVGLINDVFGRLGDVLNARYGISLSVPMGWEIKSGSDWLNGKEIHKGGHV
jgi:DNA polymerase I-like protein with 3'-5' exonuclease and polymerase domains